MPLPKPRDGESEEDFISRCIPMAIDDQDLDADSEEDRQQASAICYSRWREDDEDKAVDEQDLTVDDVKSIVSEMLEDREPDTLISTGGGVKALGEGLIGGYLVRFTSADEPDLEGDYFDASTDFGPHLRSLVFYHHGQDGTLGKSILDEGAKIEERDAGIWIEAQLDLRNAYERMIYGAAQEGKMGWSSGTAPHLVERTQVKGTYHIDKWPLGLDASITPTPADAGNVVQPLKSYVKSVGDAADLHNVGSEFLSEGEPPKGAGASVDLHRRQLQARAKALELESSEED